MDLAALANQQFPEEVTVCRHTRPKTEVELSLG